jgi:hypothetical protein
MAQYSTPLRAPATIGPTQCTQCKVHLPSAAINPKHLAGFKLAPVYPGFTVPVAKLQSPRANPISNGPSAGPKMAFCRGSRPIPYARKISAKQVIVSRTNASPAVTADGSIQQPGMTPSGPPGRPRAARMRKPATVAPVV